ncbi:hypothetical protein NBH00_05050 [Paraconexibacter antarcticus]|uniref:HNH endonuclease n=1 Tax=Paraconexibacter antarcticus TaxID=2949664 RepID=A0ABY5DY40_9ACTN|nr:hypothetical protein [Paraconexibacter antarcticus]UTI65577.1 hypothetical protein NBH00_05050 [Paraconexibacter antarcticus]
MKPGRKPDPSRPASAAEHAASEKARYSDLPRAKKRAIVNNRDRDAQQAADRRRHERDNGKRNAKQRDYQAKTWESGAAKRKARATARMMDPQPCASCGASKVEAHHTDYSKPKEITWLCPTCHGQQHQKSPQE